MAGDARTWYNSVGSNSGSQLTVAYDDINVNTSTGQATLVNPRFEFWSKTGWSDSANSVTSLGTTVSSTAFGARTLSGGTTTYSCTPVAVPIVYGATTSATLIARVTGISFFNGDSSTNDYQLDITLPARPYVLPSAPTATGAARVSDTNVTVSITHGAVDASKPITNTYIERSRNDGAWTNVATLSGAPTSWSDTGTFADSKYAYRVRTWNSTGYSGYGPTSAAVYTTPGAAANLVATKQVNGDISVAFEFPNGWPYGTVALQDNGSGSWVQVATGGATPIVHTAPSTGYAHTYRVVVTTPTGGLTSTSSLSNTVTLLATPNPPTNLSSGVFDPTEALTVTWQHNPVDTTAQTKYQVQWRKQGTTTWTTLTAVTSTASQHTFAADTFTASAPGSIEWQVKTWGQFATGSSFSATAVYLISRRPVMGFTAPAAAPQSGTITATWTYSDTEGSAQAGWRARLFVNAALVETRTGSTGLATTFSTVVADTSTVRVEGEVRDSDGMWSNTATTSTYTVAYALPAVPAIDATFDPVAGVVTVQLGNNTSLPTVTSNRVLADDGQGGWRLVGTTTPNGAVIDKTPRPGTSNYRIETISNLPSIRTTTASVATPATNRFWFTSADGTTTLFAMANPSVQVESKRAHDLVEFEGRDWPVNQKGQMLGQTLSLSARLVDSSLNSTADAWEAAPFADADYCYRDPYGRRIWVSIDSTSITRENVHSATLSVRMTRIGSLDVVVA